MRAAPHAALRIMFRTDVASHFPPRRSYPRRIESVGGLAERLGSGSLGVSDSWHDRIGVGVGP